MWVTILVWLWIWSLECDRVCELVMSYLVWSLGGMGSDGAFLKQAALGLGQAVCQLGCRVQSWPHMRYRLGRFWYGNGFGWPLGNSPRPWYINHRPRMTFLYQILMFLEKFGFGSFFQSYLDLVVSL